MRRDTLSNLRDLAFIGFVWAFFMVSLGAISRVMYELFMVGFRAW